MSSNGALEPGRRAELLDQLRTLNAELRQRGAIPAFNVGAVEEVYSDDEIRQALRLTLREVMALREEQ
jgi:hypothetical protein